MVVGLLEYCKHNSERSIIITKINALGWIYFMPDLNDFYAFKMTSSDGDSGGGRKNNSNGGRGGNSGCVTALIVLAVIGWVLCLIGK